ncbi:hypothetical protein ASPACDRAFT_1909013 [Aspergillus aculeatus ATCC 16872]|uniref:non-reducing end alpha-L-arabinofuranosidase n=1 Tax=Aspergillus aculeatus (strain ATCC 16872 / CBS 172.66 / WB 5094) TaxID=690307 RepID=A0A1L9WEM2_ASPA1|nr:uncharacterized protein ASPACDRAFT_1909013 [Aspergillus aculeatus ATCC 16872]OJJ94632.1 hypothetical protein ASPACDRAFT_1909013 [Aspergillus aculeatus ATCC 16872]
MTTFTRISEEDQPSISTSAEHTISEIDPLLYGGFAEHMGRCIYGGIYDPTNKNGLIDENGFRTDVIECMKELKVPIMRYPGGNFTATYHWLDGVGPRDQRPKRVEAAWKGVETNHFGTDEFMKWCEIIGAQPYLALNMGTGTLEEALGWLEYCNLDTDTYYANLRRQNGREEPYGVKYWALGNEVWGPWQVEQASKEDYAKKAYQWGKGKSFPIPLVLCGKDGHSDWDRYVLQECLKVTDLHSIHIYTFDMEHYPNATSPKAAERAIEIAASLIDLARTEMDYEDFPNFVTKPKTSHRPKISFDEWNIWNPIRAPGNKGAEELYDVSDMTAVALWLNVFVRQARHLSIATIAQSVNVIAPLMTNEEGVIKQTTYWPLLLFSTYMRGHSVAVHVRSPVYRGRTTPEWLASTMDISLLDVSASLSDDNYLNLAVVNVSDSKSIETSLPAIDGPVEVFCVGGNDNDIRDTNTWGSQKVGVKESTWDGQGKFLFQKHSFTLLRWKVNPSRSKIEDFDTPVEGKSATVLNALHGA